MLCDGMPFTHLFSHGFACARRRSVKLERPLYRISTVQGCIGPLRERNCTGATLLLCIEREHGHAVEHLERMLYCSKRPSILCTSIHTLHMNTIMKHSALPYQCMLWALAIKVLATSTFPSRQALLLLSMLKIKIGRGDLHKWLFVNVLSTWSFYSKEQWIICICWGNTILMLPFLSCKLPGFEAF